MSTFDGEGQLALVAGVTAPLSILGKPETYSFSGDQMQANY
jgi:hypothetical protein